MANEGIFFFPGDRVRINERCTERAWWGKEGIVVEDSLLNNCHHVALIVPGLRGFDDPKYPMRLEERKLDLIPKKEEEMEEKIKLPPPAFKGFQWSYNPERQT